jgi:hypothetical protein
LSRNGFPPRKRARLLIAAGFLLLATACNADKVVQKEENVRPPQPGTPATPADVSGIYRTIHQGVLQLRSDGSFVLIVPAGPGPSSGTFTLADGNLTVHTDVCGGAEGDYRVTVTGKPIAGQATLTFTAVRDDCDSRRRYLTVDPWVYANS